MNAPSDCSTTRRRFSFWLGFGLFTLSDRLGIDKLDQLAAAAMQDDKPKKKESKDSTKGPAVHWTRGENEHWLWFERESKIDGKWTVTGITTPFNKLTGEPYRGRSGYLDESLVPNGVRYGKTNSKKPKAADAGKPSAERRQRHGRPPSRWLRSLNAPELRTWLKTVDPPEAGVSGMTFWEHLTRDHSFDPVRIKGLSLDEQAKLHAAAHFGY